MMETNRNNNTSTVWFEPDSNEVVLIESVADFSDEEIDRCWYSHTEMQKMQKRCLRDAQHLESKTKRLSSSRGLESLTTQGKKAMTSTIYACVDAVMDEQEIQWTNGCDDSNRLAIASRKVTKYSKDQAIERAIYDEKVARMIHGGHDLLSTPPRQPKRTEDEQSSSSRCPAMEEPICNTIEPEKEISFQPEPSNKKENMHVDLGTSSSSSSCYKDIRGPSRILVAMRYHRSAILSTGMRAKAA